MPTEVELLDAAATIIVVAAAHVRQMRAGRRNHERVEEKLAACARRLDLLSRKLERWSGLP